jgi:mono/diheme cytochrome c family protein
MNRQRSVPARAVWLATAGVALALAALVGAAVIYGSNMRLLQRLYPVIPSALPPSVTGDPVRGKRLADITGCTDCHGPDLRGKVFIDDGWWTARYFASNLTLKAQQYSDEDLARIIRSGVRPDGLGVVAMPAFAYVRLTDAELADIIAFIRSLPAGGAVQPAHHLGPLEHWRLWTGKVKPAAAYVEAEAAKSLPDVGPAYAEGRHLVGIVCVECHGGDLTGNGWDTGAPDLAVAGSYSATHFARLLRTGEGADGKEHGLMSLIARDRLHRLSDADITAIHAYLLERARQPR